ncbi:hypothetical protein BDZ91DRAFT_711640 [Kalaharituber pfeilii]|nr:hypothetical protein BDZ91DRAFT_711640 [Kalaharituber pfeilii]
MSCPLLLQNLREGDRSTGSGSTGTGSTTTTTFTAIPHPIPPNANISTCPFSSQPNCTTGPITARITVSDTLPPPVSPLPVYPTSHKLISSPYTTEENILDLSALSPEYRLFALALSEMRNIVPTYATSPYTVSFNWGEVVSTFRALHEHYAGSEVLPGIAPGAPLPRTTAYAIVFRSRRAVPLVVADGERLGELDLPAHAEANKSGGLLKYWYGVPDSDTGRNLATCLWVDREHAVRGGSGPGHKEAMAKARGFYVGLEVERLRFVVEEGAEGWSVEKW